MDYSKYISPFSWRYGSDEIRQIWSENNKRLLWRKLWVALAEAQSEFGLISKDQIEDLKTHQEEIDIPRANQIEAIIHHDLMAEIKTYAEQCKIGGGVIHLGATSMDIVDNADALRVQQSLTLILNNAKSLLLILIEKIEQYADLPVMGYTHIQPAEPTTLGYRFAQYAQDIWTDYKDILLLHNNLKGKGFKGAVGTAAAYVDLLGKENLEEFENLLSKKIGLPFFNVSTQTYPRKQDYQITSALAGMGASLYKMAFDLRILQSPPFGELSEPLGENQVGSSAMPFKRNPINAEKIDSLGRLLAQMPRIAWDNAAHSLLERTLDDSANRRSTLPETFLICDELLSVSKHILNGLRINSTAIDRNMEIYGPFAATERVLVALVKKGADRQNMHEHIRKHTLKAWDAIQNNQNYSLVKYVSEDQIFLEYLKKEDILGLMVANTHIGLAPEWARQLSKDIKDYLT